MRVNKRTFDCVEFKHKAAGRINARLRGLSRNQQLEYWKKRTDILNRIIARAEMAVS
ncbi:MAG: hypothetical protein HQL20_10275 [Candidatus Omnitrophica bacterium]|nr:hypothetical protein [Candidatus Omnitrophota bacterium]